MTLLLEKTPVEFYEAELAATPVPESPADLLPAAATQAPPVAPADVAVSDGTPNLAPGGSVAKIQQLDADGKPIGEWVHSNIDSPVKLSSTATDAMWAAIPQAPYPHSLHQDWPNGWHVPEQPAPHPYEPSPRQIALILTGAADHIDEAGWAQGTLFRGDKSCAQGAIIYKVLGNRQPSRCGGIDLRASRLFEIAEGELAVWLKRNATGEERLMSVPRWNDVPGRTKDQVTHALRSAAQHVLANGLHR